MSYLKNSTTLFVILLLSTPSNGHGPSRQKVSESIEINASSDEVWKIVSDFNNFNWNKSVEKISVTQMMLVQREPFFSNRVKVLNKNLKK